MERIEASATNRAITSAYAGLRDATDHLRQASAGTRRPVQRLPPEVAELIAAGEVIDRPASVVRELVDNAIDAGATHIEVRCGGDPCASIAVHDDGFGIAGEELELALERHATSKLRRIEDLETLWSFGFRGEALPSIAAVAKLTVASRTEAMEVGRSISSTPEGARRCAWVARSRGTCVTVSDLFRSLPARYKFLRSVSIEQACIAEVLARLALSAPGVHFELWREGRRVRRWPAAQSLHERAQQVLGHQLCFTVSGQRDGVQLHAALASVDKARSRRTGLHLLVNGRPVRNQALTAAVSYAYGDTLPGGRFPVGVVEVALSPADLDVNVHPQKAEVRLRDGRRVVEATTRILAPALRDAGASAPAPAAVEHGAYGGQRGGVVTLRDAREEAHRTPPVTPGEAAAAGAAQAWDWVQVVREDAIVCADSHELLIIDGHALDECRRLHDLLSAYEARALTPQDLVFPERFELCEGVLSWWETQATALRRLGIAFTRSGPQSITIHALPALCAHCAPSTLLRCLLMAPAPPAFDALALLRAMACEGAHPRGHKLSIGAARQLLARWGTLGDLATTARHARVVLRTVHLATLPGGETASGRLLE